MTRTEFEQWLQDFYEARLSNDADRCMRFFSAHSTFQEHLNALHQAETRFLGRSYDLTFD